MKKIQLICLACWLSLNVVEAKKIKGYYVNNTDDTIMVTFSIPMNSLDGEPSFLRLQWEVTFLDEKNEKWVLKPGEVKEIVFDYGEEHIRMLSRENTLELSRGFTSPKEYLFLRLMKDGRMKLFKYYYRIVDYGIFTGLRAGVDSGYNPEIHTNDILQKNDGKLFPAGNRQYNCEEMADFLSDCPKLAQKVKDKIYQSFMVETIVDEYNWTCQ